MAVAIEFGSQGSAASSSSVATIAGLDFNAEAGDRLIAAAITVEVTATITGVTIGGVTATERRQARYTPSTPDNSAAIFVAAITTGTSGDVVVTLSANDAAVAVSTFSITGAEETPTDSDSATGGGADVAISALTIPTDGAGLACFCNANSSTAVTWTGATASVDANISSAHRHSTAIVTTAGTNTITADGGTAAQALVGVAWGPAAGGSTAYDADLTAGSFALTGTSITVPTARNAALTAGSFALTGSNLTVPTARNAALTAGSFAVTGSNLTVPTARNAALSAGSFAVTGSDLTVPTARNAALDPGSFTITGSDVDGVYVDNGVTIDYTADLSPGAFALTGSSVDAVATGQTTADTHDGIGYGDPYRRKRRPKKGKREKAVEDLLKNLMGLVPDDPPPEIEAEAEIAQASVERLFAPTVDVTPNLEALQFAQLQLAKLEAMLNRYIEESEDEDDLLLMAA